MMLKTSSIIPFLALVIASLAGFVNGGKMPKDGYVRSNGRELAEKQFFVKFVPDVDELISTGGVMELFSEYDNSGPTGLSGQVGDYFLIVTRYQFPAEGVVGVNDNKLTFVLDDDDKSTLVFGGIFYTDNVGSGDIAMPTFGGSGVFEGATEVIGSTDGQVAIFNVKF